MEAQIDSLSFKTKGVVGGTAGPNMAGLLFVQKRF